TSNICTAQVLLAVIAGLYGAYHGPDGLRAIARRVHDLAARAAAALRQAGIEVVHDRFFDTLTVPVPGRARDIHETAHTRRINLREVDDDTVGISFDETSDRALVGRLLEVFGAGAGDVPAESAIPPELERTSAFMTHPVFASHRSEHQMLRYLRTLADRDLAL